MLTKTVVFIERKVVFIGSFDKKSLPTAPSLVQTPSLTSVLAA